MKKCVGSGFCCIMEPCKYAQKIHGEHVAKCPELKFRKGRYWCDLIKEEPDMVKDMIGTGCGVSWNRWREDIKERTYKDYIEYSNSDFINDIGRMRVSRREKKKD